VTPRRALLTPTLLCAALALLPVTASADRVATGPETSAILHVYGPAPTGCVKVRVSTVLDGNYALALPESAAPTAACPSASNHGVAILKIRGGHWHVIFRAMSLAAIRCPITGVSTRVVGDLIVKEYPTLPCPLPENEPPPGV
jgi:hypothetical protein